MRHRLLTLTLIFFLLPTTIHALPKSVERWRPQVRASLKAHHVYSKWWENKELAIIYRESRGHTNTGHRAGCFGILQFGAGWKHHGGYGGHHHADWRGCPYCSIHRFAHVLKRGGKRAVVRAWRATW